jgi:hypothetical protein
MRATPDKLQRVVVWLPVDQHKIGLHVAIPIVFPVTSQRVTVESRIKRLIGSQRNQHRQQIGLKRFSVQTLCLAPLAAFELSRSIDGSHSICAARIPALIWSSVTVSNSPARAARIAAIVVSFGISGSKDSALSRAIFVSISRTASDTVSPLAASTAAASFHPSPAH